MNERPEPSALRSQRLVLEPFAAHCISPAYVGWLNDRELMRFSNQRFKIHTQDSARAYLASFAGGPNLFLAINLAADGRMIGTATAYVSVEHRTADMGLLIGDRSLWGRGLGLEAWSSLMEHLFQARSVRKVTGGAVRSNAAMIRIMERSGMHLEATRSRQEIVEGVEQDVLHYARFLNR